MPNLDRNVEQWLDVPSNSVWERDPSTKIFSLVRYRGKKVDGRWDTSEITKALGCGLSNSKDDGASAAGAVMFPCEFNFSPNTGKPITKIKSIISTWLPVNGNENLKRGLLRGGCITNHPLKLKKETDPTQDPDVQLPLPGQGYYRFCVASFGLSSSFLLALDSEHGEIYCWIPSKHEWGNVTPTSGEHYLSAMNFPRGDWRVEAQDLAGGTILFWPSDRGLIAIKVDILSLSYETLLLAEGQCLSVPCILKEKVFVIIKNSDGVVRVISADMTWIPDGSHNELAINDIPSINWTKAAATPHEVIWLSDRGQVVLRPNAQQYLFIPWEDQVEPQLQLGGPHCSSDGRLFMQVFHPTLHEGESGFGYIQLGCSDFNTRKELSFSARILTGNSSIKVEKWLKEDPWVEPTVVATMSHEVVVPILESLSEKTLLVMRVDHLHGITQLFEKTKEIFSTRFQILGQHTEDGFYLKDLRKPWVSCAFIFDGILFLYHPDVKLIPGWLIDSNTDH